METHRETKIEKRIKEIVRERYVNRLVNRYIYKYCLREKKVKYKIQHLANLVLFYLTFTFSFTAFRASLPALILFSFPVPLSCFHSFIIYILIHTYINNTYTHNIHTAPRPFYYISSFFCRLHYSFPHLLLSASCSAKQLLLI